MQQIGIARKDCLASVKLPKSLIEDDPNGVRKVEAAHIFIGHWDVQAPVPILANEFFRQPAGLPAEDQAITITISPIGVDV